MLKRIWLLPLLLFLLAACGTSSVSNGGDGEMVDELSVSTEGLTKGEGFIIRLENDRALVNDSFYTIDQDTHLVSLGEGGEKELSFEDLKPGMKVEIYNSGIMLTSFPGQGYADIFVVKKDKESIEQSQAFQAFLSGENRGNLVLVGQIDYSDDQLLFNFIDMDTDETFHTELKVSDQTYTISPVTQ